MLYSRTLLFIYSIYESLTSANPKLPLHPSPKPLPWQQAVCSLCLYVSGFIDRLINTSLNKNTSAGHNTWHIFEAQTALSGVKRHSVNSGGMKVWMTEWAFHCCGEDSFQWDGLQNSQRRDFPGGAAVKNPPAHAGDTVQALVREDPTCRGATKPMRHNYWACALEPASHNCEPVHHNYWSSCT